jgi:hypothetical protein
MKKLLIIITSFVVCFSSPVLACARTAELDIDTGGNSINALEATIVLPSTLHVESIGNGSSMVLIWIKEPTLDPVSNTIFFTGLTPGGFSGKHEVLSFSGDFTSEDLRKITVAGVTALLNDGKGTLVPVQLTFTEGTSTEDTDAPLSFTPTISTSDNVSDGQAFVTFLTQDKGSGIDHYEYATSRFRMPKEGSWQRTTSPLVLTSSEQSKIIFIRAVDRKGNIQTVDIKGPKYYEWMMELVILIGISLCALYFFGKRFFK